MEIRQGTWPLLDMGSRLPGVERVCMGSGGGVRRKQTSSSSVII